MLTPTNTPNTESFLLSREEAEERISLYVFSNVTEADIEDIEGFVSWSSANANDYLGDAGLDCDSMVVVWNAMSLA